MNFRQIGSLNVLLLGLLILPYLLNLLNRKIFNSKHPSLRTLIKGLRSIHKPLGAALLVAAFSHGYMALGRVSLHTGTILYTGIVIQIILGGIFYFQKQKKIFLAHRINAYVVAGLFLLHRLAPEALSGLLN